MNLNTIEPRLSEPLLYEPYINRTLVKRVNYTDKTVDK